MILFFSEGDHVIEGDIMIPEEADPKNHHFAAPGKVDAEVTTGVRYKKWDFPIRWSFSTSMPPSMLQT